MTNAYVAWVDVMGVRAIMSRSLPITANFVFKLHVAALDAPQKDLVLYPIMDGIYVVAKNRKAIRDFLEYVFTRTADVFVSTPAMHHRFIVKGALAYGPIIHGGNVPDAASPKTLSKDPKYKSAILLGIPVVQASQSEPKAPPFGVFVHESARAFAPAGEKPFQHVWWSWFQTKEWNPLAVELSTELDRYFTWCEARSEAIEYDPERIEHHRRMTKQFFSDVKL
ncbi:hypothetical protein [Candidatus Binatus sp.]|uniref:hypothetical protein n=1 Tax=Candidatus Binatus sp. TaxID=2811406 RepID=UPI003C761D2A